MQKMNYLTHQLLNPEEINLLKINFPLKVLFLEDLVIDALNNSFFVLKMIQSEV